MRAFTPLRLLVCITALLGCAPAADLGSSAGELVITDRCDVAGMGVLAEGDLMAGSITGEVTGVVGAWSHFSPDDGLLLAEPDWVLCRINGVLLGDFGGSATVNAEAGYTYRVHVQDFGDPDPGQWVRGPAETRTLSASRDYRPTQWQDAEVTERSFITVPAELPVVEGSAGNQWAWLTLHRAGSEDLVTCRYRGTGSNPHDSSAAYALERCTGEFPGTDEVEAGDEVEIRHLSLRVQSGDSFSPSRENARTTVEVELTLSPLVHVTLPGDFYRLTVWDAAGNEAFVRQGNLVAGNLVVTQLD